MTNDELREEVLEETLHETETPENNITENPSPLDENSNGAEPVLNEEENEYSKEEIEELLKTIHEHQREFSPA